MTSASIPQAGLVLAGRYRLERELGRGGMGSVWLALHTSLKSKVAVKVLTPGLALDDASARFLAEARAVAGLNSPYVVKLFDHGVEGGLAFLVMELLEGETLAARLRREGTLTPRLAAHVFGQLGRAVAKAHAAAIIHRDLKPDNVFLVRDGMEVHVKVLDFGIAKTLHAMASGSPQTDTGTTMGTVYYMSPEQIEDSKRVSFQSDLWSMAVMAFECLVGRRPFEAENIAAVVLCICQREPPVPSQMGTVPSGFDAWFAQATARDPRQRFGSVAEAMSRLVCLCDPELGSPRSLEPQAVQPQPAGATEPALAERTTSPVSSDQFSRPVERAGRRRRPIALAVALLAVVAAAWLALRQGSPAPSSRRGTSAVAPPETAPDTAPAAPTGPVIRVVREEEAPPMPVPSSGSAQQQQQQPPEPPAQVPVLTQPQPRARPIPAAPPAAEKAPSQPPTSSDKRAPAHEGSSPASSDTDAPPLFL